MEVQVTITEICPMETVVSKTSGKEYHKYKFIGKTQDSYPKEICFETLGDDKFAQFNIMVGQNYIVSFDIESRRWNDKFFTSITAWRVQPSNGQQQIPVQQPYQQPMMQQQPVQQAYQQPMQPQQGYGFQQPTPQPAPAPMQATQPNNDQLPF
jgi:hypothetical protein